MNSNAFNGYLHTRIMTASPEQLQLLLYDGAIRFARQGREALAAGTLDVSCEKLLRAQRIVLELGNGLRFDVDRDLGQRLAGLYHYIYGLLVKANMKRDVAATDEAIELLEFQRQTWVMLLDKLARDRGQADTAPARPAGDGSPQSAEPVAVDVAG